MNDHDFYVYSAIGLLAVCTLLTRTTFMLFGHRMPLSEEVRRALRYAPAAALTAIIVPELLPWRAQSGGAVVDERLLAALVAIWLFHKTRNSLVMIAGGMVFFWILRAALQYI
ncbi:AzlD domain-containing protein [Orrella marina]|uniref:AzlD domain-containing protein n=1 Tax=Orrella marina TaxID=2163011 RepID=A0A2R4XNK6_9BURK|nr:AzlD domain-containing protein [Orrella marina]AWB35371.1 hypothetical protein DBV39_18315 [Orrella marina]